MAAAGMEPSWRKPSGMGLAREGSRRGGAFGDGPAEDGPAIIRSSSSSPACVRGAISRSTVALARLPSTWPLTTIVPAIDDDGASFCHVR